MAELLWLAGKAFLMALVLTPIIRDISRSFNIVDRPGVRKIHAYPIPRVGGVAIAVAYLFALLSISGSGEPFNAPDAWKLIPGATIVFATGILDDLFSLKPVVKLAGLILGASVVFWSGLSIGDLASYHLPVWLNYPLTVFWLLLTSNALNLIDGLDGLCAGMGLLSTVALFSAAILHHNDPLAYATLPLAGALAGFLCHNLNPATVFLGDSGALLVGFLVGCYGMIWNQKTSTMLSMLVPLLALSIPLLEVSLSVFRRILRKQPIFKADREHIHHRLLDRGLSPRQAVGILYVVAAIGAVFALVASAPVAGHYQGFLVLFICLIAAAGIRQLRYGEFAIPSRLLFRGIRQKLTVEQLGSTLERSATEDRWWDRLTEAGGTLGLITIRLTGGESVYRQWQNFGQPVAWSFQIALTERQSLEIEGTLHAGAASFDLLRFAEIVKVTFPAVGVPAEAADRKVASVHS